MSGYPSLEIQRALVRSLNGRCVPNGGGVLAKDGEWHENCATCRAFVCGAGLVGFTDEVEVARVWGSDAIELRWPCPGCGCEVTQETTALASLAEAQEVKRDPLCYRCRSKAGEKR